MLTYVNDFFSHKLDNINRGHIRAGWGQPAPKNDELINKICDSFIQRTKNETIVPNNSEWSGIVNRHEKIINALQNRDIVFLNQEFSNLFASVITNGTTQGLDQTLDYKNADPNILYNHLLYVYDKLLDVVESVGLLTAFSPEEYVWVKDYDKFLTHPDSHLNKIFDYYKNTLNAPSYSGMMFGLNTSYGVYSIKDMHAMGLALSLYDKFKDNLNIRICEIGAGVGQMAYYMNKLGFTNYSIVDLLTISVSQMYFLGTNLPDNSISHLSPDEFDGKFDVVVNVDSLPEMSISAAQSYIKRISENCRLFISVNQERRKTFLVQDLCKENNLKRISRNLFWLRKGFVIEEWTRA